MFCPQCRAEYVPGITRCADCDIELVETLPSEKPRPKAADDATVTVFSSHDPGLVAIAQSVLESAGLRVLVRGSLLPYPGALPVELQVLASEADEARGLLAELPPPVSEP